MSFDFTITHISRKHGVIMKTRLHVFKDGSYGILKIGLFLNRLYKIVDEYGTESCGKVMHEYYRTNDLKTAFTKMLELEGIQVDSDPEPIIGSVYELTEDYGVYPKGTRARFHSLEFRKEDMAYLCRSIPIDRINDVQNYLRCIEQAWIPNILKVPFNKLKLIEEYKCTTLTK